MLSDATRPDLSKYAWIFRPLSFVELERKSEPLGDAVARHVVVRGTEPAGDNEHSRHGNPLTNDARDLRSVVADDVDPLDADTDLEQTAPEVLERASPSGLP